MNNIFIHLFNFLNIIIYLTFNFNSHNLYLYLKIKKVVDFGEVWFFCHARTLSLGKLDSLL